MTTRDPEKLIDSFFRLMNIVNFSHAPLEAKHYNATYLAKLAMIPDENVRTSTVLEIVKSGVKNAMQVLSIHRLPRILYKSLENLFTEIKVAFSQN